MSIGENEQMQVGSLMLSFTRQTRRTRTSTRRKLAVDHLKNETTQDKVRLYLQNRHRILKILQCERRKLALTSKISGVTLEMPLHVKCNCSNIKTVSEKPERKKSLVN